MTDRLLTPSREIVSLDQAREEKEAAKKRPPASKMSDYVSRDEMMMAVGKASLALGQKMYDQVSGELAENFEDQEERLIQLIQRTFAALEREREARTLRGRWRALVRWARVQGGWVPPSSLQIEANALVEAFEATTPPPGMKEAAVLELRRRIATCEDGADVTVPEGLTKEDALAIAKEYDDEVRATVEQIKAEGDAPNAL